MNAQIIRTLITGILLAGTAVAHSASLPASHSVANGLMVAGQQQISLDQAIAQVRRQTGGRILSASTQNRGGRVTHRIKVLMPNGVVRVVNVNAGNRR